MWRCSVWSRGSAPCRAVTQGPAFLVPGPGSGSRPPRAVALVETREIPWLVFGKRCRDWKCWNQTARCTAVLLRPAGRQVEEELQEQEFLDRCFQEMLDEEDQDWFIPSRDLPQGMGQLQQQLNGLSVGDGHASEDILSKSNLNPDAKEFVPGVKY